MDSPPYDSLNSDPTRTKGRLFTPMVALTQVLGLLAVILVAVWTAHFRGGFAWTSNPGLEFNLHPLLMIIGMVYLQGNAILIYRVIPATVPKTYVKAAHAVIHILALICMAVGLKAVFDSHNLPVPPIPNLYSLHSWMGIVLTGMFSAQWLLGIVLFVVPGIDERWKAYYKSMHVVFGAVMFGLTIATCLTGITEKIFFVAAVAKYSQYSSEGMVVNFLGMTLVALAGVVLFLVANPRYARPPPSGEVQNTTPQL